MGFKNDKHLNERIETDLTLNQQRAKFPRAEVQMRGPLQVQTRTIRYT